MTATQQKEISAELKALLVANEIPLDPIEWREKEEEADKIRKAHRHACTEIFRVVQSVESPSYALRIDPQNAEEVKRNPENIAKLRDLVTALETEDAKLQAALKSGLFAEAGKAQSEAWKRQDNMHRLYRSLRRDYERLQYVASHRFTQALKELRERGFVAKQTGRPANLIEGVPALYPQGSKAGYAWDFWPRGTHDSEGNLTSAGQALEATFNAWGIVFDFMHTVRSQPILRIRLSDSDSIPLPRLELINELGEMLGLDEVEA
jgi:hypothetical protein